MYVLRLDPTAPLAFTLGVTWAGYFSGAGYSKSSANAVKFPTMADAALTAESTMPGLNGCMKIIKVN